MSGRYTVEFERSAKKEFDRLDGPIRARVLRKVAALEDDPGHLVPLGWLVPRCQMLARSFGACFPRAMRQVQARELDN